MNLAKLLEVLHARNRNVSSHWLPPHPNLDDSIRKYDQSIRDLFQHWPHRFPVIFQISQFAPLLCAGLGGARLHPTHIVGFVNNRQLHWLDTDLVERPGRKIFGAVKKNIEREQFPTPNAQNSSKLCQDHLQTALDHGKIDRKPLTN